MIPFIIASLAVLAVVASVVLGFNTTGAHGPIDDRLKMESAVTKTADFDGTTLNVGSGYAPGGPGQPHSVTIQTTALDLASTDETYKFKVQESADAVTWTDCTHQVSVTAAGVKSIPFFLSQPNVRVNLDVGGTTPSITYSAWLTAHQS